jgi:hypothetical protein
VYWAMVCTSRARKRSLVCLCWNRVKLCEGVNTAALAVHTDAILLTIQSLALYRALSQACCPLALYRTLPQTRCQASEKCCSVLSSLGLRRAVTVACDFWLTWHGCSDRDVAPKFDGMGRPAQAATKLLANNVRSDSAPLPHGWERKLDLPSGKVFYVNHSLRAISWEPPPGEEEAGAIDHSLHTSAHSSNRPVAQRPRQPTSRSAHAQSPPDFGSFHGSDISDLSSSFDPGARHKHYNRMRGLNSDFLPSAGRRPLDFMPMGASSNSGGVRAESPTNTARSAGASVARPRPSAPLGMGSALYSAEPLPSKGSAPSVSAMGEYRVLA